MKYKRKATHSKGYPMTKIDDHPRADARGYVFDHVLIAEKALGKPLPKNACVHHVNGGTDGPIIICQDNAYHKYIHQRMRAYNACGHAFWRKCGICHKYDSPDNLYINPYTGKGVRHRECWKKYYNSNRDQFNEWQRQRRAKNNDIK